MKTSKLTLVIAMAMLMTGLKTYAQKLENKVYTSAAGVEFKVGDDITIGYPSNGVDFVNIAEHLKGFKKLTKVASDIGSAGSQLVSSGYDAGSSGAVKAGASLNKNGAAAARLTSLTDKLSPGAKPIAGKKLRILKFKVDGNAERGEHFFAFVAAEDNKDYKIEIEPAIESKEIVAVGSVLLVPNKKEELSKKNK
jgi:hypothetical protein